MLRLEAVRAICIAASLENGALGVRIERPGHHDFAVFPLRGDEPVGRLAVLDPIHDYGKPIHLRSAGTAAAVKTAGNHEEPAIVASLHVMRLHLAIVID